MVDLRRRSGLQLRRKQRKRMTRGPLRRKTMLWLKIMALLSSYAALLHTDHLSCWGIGLKWTGLMEAMMIFLLQSCTGEILL